VSFAESSHGGVFTAAEGAAFFGGGAVGFAFASLDGYVGAVFVVAFFAWGAVWREIDLDQCTRYVLKVSTSNKQR
jgi:hypothetical protein